MNLKKCALIMGSVMGLAGCSFNPADNSVVMKYGMIPDSSDNIIVDDSNATVIDDVNDYNPEDDEVIEKYGVSQDSEEVVEEEYETPHNPNSVYNPFDDSMTFKYGVFNE